MAIRGSYRGMSITIPDLDNEHLGYFQAAAQHKLVVKKCADCARLRWPPTPGCYWCGSLNSEWQEVSGKGTIYSYEIITQAIQRSFTEWVPYPVVLVELDEQSGDPTPDHGLRMIANLVDEHFNPEKEEDIAIGKRVEVCFLDAEGITLPQFKLSAEQPTQSIWQFTQR